LKKIKKVLFFANGNIAAFDESDKQVPELQEKTSIKLWAEFCISLGYNVDACLFSTQSSGLGGVIKQNEGTTEILYLTWKAD
jgi:hypothetical protein